MKTNPTSQSAPVQERDPDFVNAEFAIKRAVQRARGNARKQGVPVVTFKDGKIQEKDLSATEDTE